MLGGVIMCKDMTIAVFECINLYEGLKPQKVKVIILEQATNYLFIRKWEREAYVKYREFVELDNSI